MAFSKRIRILASLIEPNKNIVDIGCDHALLDIYLTLYNHNSCIATDINEKAIQHAKENIKKYNQASRANSSRHSANTISEVFQPNISRG